MIVEYKWSVGEMPPETATAFAMGTEGQAIAQQAIRIEKLMVDCEMLGVPKRLIREAAQGANACEVLEDLQSRALRGDTFDRENNTFLARQYELAENMAALQAEMNRALGVNKLANALVKAITWLGHLFSR